LQVVLVASGAARWHRRVGIAAAAVAALMIITAIVAQVERTGRVMADGSFARNAFVENLGLGLALLDILVFAGFVVAAIWLRRLPDQHKRLMLFATLAVVGPALVRFPAVTSLPPIAVVMSPLAFAVPLIAYDMLTRGRLVLATVWGLLISAGYHVLAMVLAGAGITAALARWVAG
jgi:hypothetical protein